LRIAGAYWTFVTAAFLVLLSARFYLIGEGAIPIAFVTFPESVVAIWVYSWLRPDPTGPYYTLINYSALGTFVVFPLISGGLNSLALYWLTTVVQRWRQRRQTV
jgi:hypothetical protein